MHCSQSSATRVCAREEVAYGCVLAKKSHTGVCSRSSGTRVLVRGAMVHGCALS